MRGIGAGTRIFEVLDRKPVIPLYGGIDLPSTKHGPVKFEAIRFEYPTRKGVEVLKDFDLEIGVGESVAIVLVRSLLMKLTSKPRIVFLEGRVVAESRPFIRCF
jgi:hypothetical protein